MLRLLALIVLLLISASTSAEWKPEYAGSTPEIRAWYSTQRNQKGEHCCDSSDAHAYFGTYRLTEDGGVELELNGELHKLPSYMVLNGPNPTGHAVWWYRLELDLGRRVDYCFAPGSLF
jgi:hypothetical protein